MAVNNPPPQSPTKTEKIMAIVIAILSGIVAALVAYTLSRHLGGSALMGVGWSAGGFVGMFGVVMGIEEKLGLL